MKEPTPKMLRFEEGAWRGINGVVDVIMTDAALQREADLYLKERGLPATRRSQALRALRQIAYWEDFDNHVDVTQPDIHVRKVHNHGK